MTVDITDMRTHTKSDKYPGVSKVSDNLSGVVIHQNGMIHVLTMYVKS